MREVQEKAFAVTDTQGATTACGFVSGIGAALAKQTKPEGKQQRSEQKQKNAAYLRQVLDNMSEKC